MPVITTSTFDPLKRYVRVRLAQGVPIVDADVNERDDIHMFELRAFLKWFVGNGVPEGNDGFRIGPASTAPATNFAILAGTSGGAPDALTNVGRCLVGGLDVIIAQNVDFTAQPLHASQAGAATLSAQLNVPVVAALAAAAGDVCVYLDVWERTVTSSEDPALVPLGLGIESCARVKREWVVRTAAGTQPPPAPAGHGHYALALIKHTGSAIAATDITDVREQRLLVPPSTLITDVFGGTALDYRRGRGRPPISLRDAINALIRGDVPTMPELSVSPALAAQDFFGRGVLFDGNNGLVAVWSSNRNTVEQQLFAARADLANPGTFGAAQQISGGGNAHTEAHAVAISGDRLLVVFEAANAANRDIKLKFGALPALTAASSEVSVAAGGTLSRPFAVALGGATPEVFLMWHDGASTTWRFARFTEPAGVGTVGSAAALSTTTTGTSIQLHAAKDASDTVWAAFTAPTSGAPAANNVRVVRVPRGGSPANPSDATLTTGDELGSTLADQDPFVLIDGAGVWVFWSAGGQALWASNRPAAGPWSPAAPLPGGATIVATTNASPAAVVDPDGTIWLFWQSNRSGNQDIWFMRRLAQTASWTDPRPLTGATENDASPHAAAGGDGIVWLFWRRVISGNGELLSKRIVAKV